MTDPITLSADELDDIILSLAVYARQFPAARKLEVYQLRERIINAHLDASGDCMGGTLTFETHYQPLVITPGNPLASTCPGCNAQPDEPCVKTDGTRLGHHHRVRREVAR